MADNPQDLKRLLDISAPVSVELINAAGAFHPNEAIQSLAMVGAGCAIAKVLGELFISRESWLVACAAIWDHIEPEFENVEVRLN